MIDRAERKGCNGIFLRVDAAVVGRQYQGIRNNFSIPSSFTLANFDGFKESGKRMEEYVASRVDLIMQWSDVTWLKCITKLTVLVLKGILTAEIAVNHYVDGIVVSSHGGRQLDMELLPRLMHYQKW